MKEGATQSKSQETVLDKGGIEFGARHASRVRGAELSEDYRWMKTILDAMDGLTVPLFEKDIVERWKARQTLEEIRGMAGDSVNDRRFIPPGEVLTTTDENGAYSKLIGQLIRLQIFFQLKDGRINMPDLFRLQVNVKRKGGMKPRA